MDINRKNYEIYAIDFVEGNLTLTDSAEFLAFLSENPDIANEVELLRETPPTLVESSQTTSFSFLKKNLNDLPINEENFDEMCIAYHEGDLNASAENALLLKVEEDKNLKARFEGFAGLKLVPDSTITYPDKKSLKQQKIAFLQFRKVVIGLSAAAAAILLFVFLNMPTNQSYFIDSMDKVIAAFKVVPENKNSMLTSTEDSGNIIPIVHKKNTKRKKKVTLPVQIKKELFAAVDTSKPEEERFIRISAIEPTQLPTRELIAEINIRAQNPKQNSRSEETIIDDFREKGAQLFTKASKITITDLIQTGIKGINQMAETDIKYEDIKDDIDNVAEFALSLDNIGKGKKNKNN